MIHYVIEEVDEGEPLLVKEINLVAGESLETLEQHIHEVEWKAIVEGTNLALDRLQGSKKGRSSS